MDGAQLGRRAFLQLGAGGLVAVWVAGAAGADAAGGTFQYGVASGDPLSDAVVIWTRVTPTAAATPGSGRGPATDVTWAVATDPAFRRVVATGRSTAMAASDHTVQVDVGGRRPGTK